jgi:Holliday junction DNA helicase RuvA
MIAFLNGKLVHKSPTRAIIDINGVGYEVHISLNTYRQLSEIGATTYLHIYLHVREDQMLLFGFAVPEEKDLFLMLISISGIGPKLAQIILSGATVEEFTESILEENISKLTRIPGVGKKTAQRLIFDLKEKLARGDSRKAPVESGAAVPGDLKSIIDEAILALISLGYSQQAAEAAIKKVRTKHPKLNTVEDLIKCALSEI